MATELASGLESGISLTTVPMADSSEDDDILTPKAKKNSLKKKRIFSDDDDSKSEKSETEGNAASESDKEEEEEQVGQKQRRSRLVRADSSSEDDDVLPAQKPDSKKDFGLRKLEKKSFDKLKKKNKVSLNSSDDDSGKEEKSDHDQEVDEQHQKKILDKLRADFGNDSSEEEDRNGRASGMSNKSSKSADSDGDRKSKKKQSAPKRKSAVACRAAMEKEKLKMISEKQRMDRESMVSLPYHKPKQRSLKEFLSARPSVSLELRGAKPSNVDITLIGKELEDTEKLAEEFYKSEEEEEERFTPTPPPNNEVNEKNIHDKVCSVDNEEPIRAVDSVKKAIDFEELQEKIEEMKETEEISSNPRETPVDTEVATVEKAVQPMETENINQENSEITLAEAEKEEKLLEVPMQKEDIAAEVFGIACLTPSEAIEEKIFAVPEPPKEKCETVEDSLEDEMHLYLEDSEEILDDRESQAAENQVDQAFDLQKLYENQISSDEEDSKIKSPIKVKKSPLKGILSRAQLIERLKNSKPVKLSGSSSDYIDLTPETSRQIGVSELKERFLRHASAGKKKSLDPKQDGFLTLIKSGENIDEVVDLNSKPGAKMCQLKSELQESIAKQRVADFKQRQNEYKMYEDETDELLGNDFEDNEKEEKNFDDFDPHLANETESEPETEPEMDEETEEARKPRVKSAFVDEEAEEEGDEDVPLKENEEEEEQEDCDGDDEEDCDEESDEEYDEVDLKASTPACKKPFSRIIRVEDSDDEAETNCGKGVKPEEGADDSKLLDENDKTDSSFLSNMNTSVNISFLNSPQSTGITNPLYSNSNYIKRRGDLNATQPDKKKGSVSNGITQMLEELHGEAMSTSFTEAMNESLLEANISEPKDLDKLNFDKDTQCTSLMDLCSGQFLTVPDTLPEAQPAVSGLKDLVSGDTSQPTDLADLCSGQFVTQAKPKTGAINKLFGTAVDETQNLEELCSGQFVTQAKTSEEQTDFNKLLGQKWETQTQDLAALCSGNFVTQSDLKGGREPSPTKADRLLEVPMSPTVNDKPLKLVISSDEDENTIDVPKSTEKKKRKKKKRKLDFSDDEDEENEDQEEEAEESGAEEGADYSLVDYDSEENEVVVKTGEARSKAARFFEAEAELSGSDWESADEDERGLDYMDEELGDKEQIDEDDMKEQLGKIHARRLLDEDKRDIRLFQEAFLEDGDLHAEGGGRQRLFRWKNTDDGDWQGGCNPNLSGDEGLEDDDEDDASWRTLRLERENWLKEKSTNETPLDANDENSQFLRHGKNLLAKINGAKLKPQAEPKDVAKKRIQPMLVKSPGKAILQRLQGKSGSFFSRTKMSLTKVVQIAGNDNDGIVSNTSKGNFVFSTISPSSIKGPAAELANNSFEEDSPQPVKAKKRQAAASTTSKAKAQAKKHKVSNSIFKLM
ncbi:claspin-like [Neocloeon triangulifer]|uniref:claspin-like n=1 Tax=Neocloeon triangulifer TaxID=2078957 RepID=UPI00286EEC17|nr:claspin-like [Neocloeon triangulifer]